MKENFSLAEAAELLRMSVARLKRFISERLLDAYKLSGFKEPRVTRFDLLAFSVQFGFSWRG